MKNRKDLGRLIPDPGDVTPEEWAEAEEVMYQDGLRDLERCHQEMEAWEARIEQEAWAVGMRAEVEVRRAVRAGIVDNMPADLMRALIETV